MSLRVRNKGYRKIPARCLEPDPLNWRLHGEGQRAALTAALERVGFVGALLVRPKPKSKTKYLVIDGHERLTRFAPSEAVPCIVVDLNEEEARIALATYDPITLLADVDHEALNRLVAEVEMDSEELDQLVQSVLSGDAISGFLSDDDEQAEDGQESEDICRESAREQGESLHKKWKIKTGQLWQIGSHRLLCGDSTNAADIERLMNGATCDICFTSPPYAQKRDYGKKIENWDALMQGVFENIPANDRTQILVNLGLVHHKNEWIPYWDNWLEWMRERGWKRFGLYAWDQGPGLPGNWNGRLAPAFELIFHFNRQALQPKKIIAKKHDSIHRPPTGNGLRKADGQMSGISSPEACKQPKKIHDSVIRVMRHKANGIENAHPAVFPIKLPETVLACWDGQTTYEPFAGSGTQFIAAEKLGKQCFGIELEPRYCAVILERLSRMGSEPQRVTE